MSALSAALALALHLSPTAAGNGVARTPREAGEIDVSGLPPEQRARYEVFRQKCSLCHSLSRAVGSRLSGEAWKRHLRRMGRRPGTALSDEHVRAISAFLEYYAPRRGRPGGAEPPGRGSPSRPFSRG